MGQVVQAAVSTRLAVSSCLMAAPTALQGPCRGFEEGCLTSLSHFAQKCNVNGL